MGVSELKHNPDLTGEEYWEEIANLKIKYASLLKVKLQGIKASMMEYFLDTHNTNRSKLMGHFYNVPRMYPQETTPAEDFVNNIKDLFSIEVLEKMLMSLEYTPYEDLPVALGNYVEGEISHTFLLWRLKVGI
jgi:hypothetical protein